MPKRDRFAALADLDGPTNAHLTAAAIARCTLCDDDGYRGLAVCDHRSHEHVGQAQRAHIRKMLTKRQAMTLDPHLIAYVDQRIALVDEFVTGMVTHWREAVAAGEIADDAVGVSRMSMALDQRLTAEGAMSDALAVAIRRLAQR